LNKRSYYWLAAVTGLLLALAAAALILPRSFRLGAISDIVQCILLFSGTASFVPLVLRSRGRMQLFWSLIALGIFFWLSYQLLWTYYEVVLLREVPVIFTGDIVLFLHIVPLMAALGLRPHIPRDEYAARAGRLDFALLVIWWIYLYVLIVIPWQYVVADAEAYNRTLSALYVTEEIAFLLALIACWLQSNGFWRSFYTSLLGMSICYAGSSAVANWAIGRNVYYSGSLYDIPLVTAMAWLTWVGLRTRANEPTSDTGETSILYGVWIARCSMIAVFSLPVFAAWAMSDSNIPARVRVFRIALTLVAAFFMGGMVLVRQYLLDRELTQLLHHSQESIDNLNRLQAQILQSEKLASIGQLAGGAAHELNNPITAMLGYSDLLLSTKLTPEQRPLAAKIGQYVRRTKSLVASLISFARQASSPKNPIDLNTLARTAIKLTQPQRESLEIEVRPQFDSTLPKVLGDSNQLLQVCLELVANCLHLLSERGGKVMTVTTERQGDNSVLQIGAEPGPLGAPAGLPSAASANPEEGLGLSACRGIVQEHRGQVFLEAREDGAILLRVELPVAMTEVRVRAKESTSLWQSQPFA
jgi:signal transduction histidine kinase